MARDRSLAGQVVVVTGGARGIGLATARHLLAQGAKVAIGDVDGGLAKEVAEGLAGGAGTCLGGDLDVTDRESFAAFLDRVEADLGPIDVLVNNAGIMPLGPLVDEPDQVTRRIVDINLHGVILGTKLATERMAARRRGHIVNIASAVGRVALPGSATYSASKYAVIGLSEATRAELRDSGLDVSVIVPMIVNTELGAGLAKVRGQRTVEPTDVAAAVARVIARPRFETWVPRTGRGLYASMFFLPKAWQDGMGRLVGASTVLSHPDRSARSGYEDRARGAGE